MSFTKRLVNGVIGSLLSLSVFLAVPALADDVSVDFSTSFLTDYIFRGINLYDGVSIQPELAVGYDLGDMGVISASAWAHLSAEGSTGASTKFTEVDYTIDYTYDFGSAAVSLGHIFYTYPDSDDGISDTNEIYASLALDLPLSPTYTYYHDYDEFDSDYFTVDLSHTVECPALGDGFNMTPYVQAAFASNAEKAYAKDGHVHTTFGVTMDLSLGDIAVVPGLHYTRESDAVADNEFFAGTTFSYSF